MDKPSFSDDEILDYARGAASADLAARIESALPDNPALRAQLSVLEALGPALQDETPAAPDELGWKRLETRIRRERPRAAPVLWRAAAVVLGALVLGQGTYLAMQVGRTGGAEYQTASQPAERYVLALGFDGAAPIAAVAELLRAADARIVGGPGASGFYRVAFDTDAAREAARAVFETSDLVELVADE